MGEKDSNIHSFKSWNWNQELTEKIVEKEIWIQVYVKAVYQSQQGVWAGSYFRCKEYLRSSQVSLQLVCEKVSTNDKSLFLIY